MVVRILLRQYRGDVSVTGSILGGLLLVEFFCSGHCYCCVIAYTVLWTSFLPMHNCAAGTVADMELLWWCCSGVLAVM